MTIANLEVRALMQEVAVHASSIWDGLVAVIRTIYLQYGGKVASSCISKCLNLPLWMPGFAMRFSRHLIQLSQVYSYEVTEALGQMVAGHLVSTGDFPTEQR